MVGPWFAGWAVALGLLVAEAVALDQAGGIVLVLLVTGVSRLGGPPHEGPLGQPQPCGSRRQEQPTMTNAGVWARLTGLQGRPLTVARGGLGRRAGPTFTIRAVGTDSLLLERHGRGDRVRERILRRDIEAAYQRLRAGEPATARRLYQHGLPAATASSVAAILQALRGVDGG